ncbi:universal stress protein [Lentimicrobium sp.]|uniref:universal stress protein n=1 Tax=Lentimicrobium sp. TaxID=2034841 RepID=UPI002B55FCDC|nr:universal stress protein [Lentimicrobium sp.]HPF63952.1 universal stress protein [Lentimicrobium sp.]
MNNILVPYDFDPQTDLAFDQAIHLARHTKSSITLLYVHEQQDFLSSLFSQEQNEEMLEKISDQMDAVAANMSFRSGVDISVRLEVGRVYSVIVDVAGETGAEFIVMGTRSFESSARDSNRMAGANTSRVIRAAHCPVITIGGRTHYDGCRTILLPLDHHAETGQKVKWAIKLAGIYGAQVRVVGAMSMEQKERVREKIRRQVVSVHDQIKNAGIGCEAEVLEVQAAEKDIVASLLNYAQSKGDIDLIIIMTQQESAIVEFFVDSSAQEFIRRSDIPVMSVVPKESAGKISGE